MARVAFLAVVGLTAGAATVVWLRSPATPRPPAVEVPAAVDGGDRHPPNATVRVTIPVANAGDSPLVLSDFRSGCGCTRLCDPADADAALTTLTVPPGERAVIAADVRLSASPGHATRTVVRFRTTAPDRPEVAVTLTAAVAAGWSVAPASVALGAVEAGATRAVRFTVRPVGSPAGPTPNRLAADPAGLARVGPLVPAAAGAPDGLFAVAEAVLVAPAAEGEFAGTVGLYAPGGALPLAVVPVTGTVRGWLTCQPDRLVLPRRGGGGPLYSARVLVRRTDGQPVADLAVRDAGGLAVRVVESPLPGCGGLEVAWDGPPPAAGSPIIRRRVLVGCGPPGRRPGVTVNVDIGPAE